MSVSYKGVKLKLAKHPCRAKVSENGNRVTCLDMFRTIRTKGRGMRKIVACASHNHRVMGKQAEVWR